MFSKKHGSKSIERRTDIGHPRVLGAFSLLVAAGLASCGGDAAVGTDEVVGTQKEALTTISDMRRTPIANPVTFSGAGIRTLLVQGSRVYMGGSFSFTFNGQTFNNLAAFDMPTNGGLGSPTVAAGFRPQPNGQVWSLATDGARLYAGGDFTTLGGMSRTRLGVVSLDTGAVFAAFTANTNGRVQAIRLTPDGAAMVVGGPFTTVNGTSRVGIAAVERLSGAVSSSRFTSGVSGGDVSAIHSGFGSMFIGGSFTNYQNHANLVATDASGNASGAVFATGSNPALALDIDFNGQGQIFAGLGGSGNCVFSFRASGPAQGSFLWQSPRTQGDVQAVRYLRGGVYFGFHDGLFVNGNPVGTVGDRYKLAGVSASLSGNPPLLFATTWPGGPCTAADSRGCWAPMMDPAGAATGFWGIWALASYTSPGGSSRLLAGGEFTQVGTVSPTKYFASFPEVP